MSTVQITNMEDLRVGDVAVFIIYPGEEYEAEVKGRLYNDDTRGSEYRLALGEYVIRYAKDDWTDHQFVSATREIPSVPSKPGSIIFNVELDNGNRAESLVLGPEERWFYPINGTFIYSKRIKAWTPGKVVADGKPVVLDA